MAMMGCPNCGEQVSDKAKKCVHCGTVLIPEEKRYCQECGAELDAEADVCPKCGCPVDNTKDSEVAPQQVEVTGVKIAKKIKENNSDCGCSNINCCFDCSGCCAGTKEKRGRGSSKKN